MSQTKIILIPMPIGSESGVQYYTEYLFNTIRSTRYWIAENARTTRRFISSLNMGIDISDLEIFELSRDFDPKNLYHFLDNCLKKGDVAVTSEAGLPGMADPGAVVVQWGQTQGIKILPLTGPGSIYLSLCASGFNGQQFVFHGYCPIKEPDLKKFLKNIQAHLIQTGYTQIFIETPYRNTRVIETMIETLPPGQKLCIARSLHDLNESVRTKTLRQWADSEDLPAKEPCVFLLGQ